NSNRRWITAVQQSTGGDGDPGCATTKSFTFPRFSANATEDIALPFGTWKIYAGNSSGSTTQQLTGSAVTVRAAVIEIGSGGALAHDVIGNSGVSGSGTVTLDPRRP